VVHSTSPYNAIPIANPVMA